MPQCSRLVDASGLLEPTPPTDLPDGQVVGDWQAAFVGQTGQLEKGNADKAGARRIISTCEDMHREAFERAKKRWWQF